MFRRYDYAMEIRCYEPEDREAVREICRRTAYGGEAAGMIDPELFADLMTRGFTDLAAGSLWVAAEDRRVVGYLAGCLDEEELHRLQSRRVVPVAVAAAVRRGLLRRRELWRLVASLPGFVFAGGLRGSPQEAAYPGHLHLNLLAEARGRAVGARLVEPFLAAARDRRLPGVRAVVYESNQPARRFFTRLGFHPLARRPAFKPPAEPSSREWKIVYVREL